jgi:RimJ/RimL family protein N-acetyltransferase
MNIRPILADELNRFAQITDHPERIDSFTQMVSAMWEAGESKPDWCFVVQVGRQLVSRIGFMSLDGRADAVAIFGWKLPWDGDYLAVGTRLLEEILSQLQQQGVRSVQRELVSTWDFLDEQTRILAAVGFRLVQEQCFYEYSASLGAVDASSRLHYKPLSVVGDEQFMDVVRQATVGTLDRAIQYQIQGLGLEEFVQQDYSFIKNEHDLDPDWWRLAYTTDGELVGFLQPVRFKTGNEGNIAYLGVIPEKRGQGYSFDLLTKATAILVQAGVERIIGRTDRQNTPMKRAYEQVGYQLESRIWTFERSLEPRQEIALRDEIAKPFMG